MQRGIEKMNEEIQIDLKDVIDSLTRNVGELSRENALLQAENLALRKLMKQPTEKDKSTDPMKEVSAE
ncbi:hypothetical protein [Paraliobacillus sediminis]|uniref:hypothetical protein n=1 Tax=Paraliobacillus sediminis TaxID=1885916 RepID=UPI0013C34E25|nr:hypothetical protein [Paraliobacillus sediminis]